MDLLCKLPNRCPRAIRFFVLALITGDGKPGGLHVACGEDADKKRDGLLGPDFVILYTNPIKKLPPSAEPDGLLWDWTVLLEGGFFFAIFLGSDIVFF